ncbi:glycerol-3-phosphate 1-O-acyltransferase PlsY [Candidatus Pelagibacter bacterium]|nr:glycerol-3-phosphate 1-O-acyltransferase PlsY [Candidatus Pelagibacter bacterium]
MDINLIIVAVYSYFLGSIPFGLVLTKIFLKKDIRNIGSGNIGSTNVLRTGKKSLAIATLVLDLLKGYFSVIVTLTYFENLTSYAALICLIGHIFPIWLKFKGGKGVAAYLGAILALSYKFFLVFGISWLILSFLFRFASLSSIASSLIIFIYAYFFNENNYSLILFIFLVIIIYTHRENIVRLKNSKENKIKL